ncbi:DedA family protein [Brevibacillus sp. SYP-B805]|uniref:DedA family protein n=1 Tax=Brevibacillus sp. SYP-B805 TaxID=1578199 RepID=UPI0013EE1AD4|nr:DedA family protein [Brevibacillus sp. SYP-B805]NGQ95917.1 DedA family protein [Brevibacillus sp. SYP-B805]
MENQAVIDMVVQWGYPALFFALWLGIVGMPIPDEVIVMTAGVTTSLGYLRVIPAFLITYLGVVSGLSLGYVLGRTMGAGILDRLRKRRGLAPHILRAERLLDRYGHYALCISYFLPVVRHVVPYLVGIGHMRFRRYAMFSYTTGFVWTLLFFLAGHLLGSNAADLEETFSQSVMAAAIGILLIWFAVRFFRSRKASFRRGDTGE